MAERRRRTLASEQTVHFVVYERRTGRMLAAHHLTALPGVRIPSEEVIVRRLRTCAADVLGRRAVDLAVLRTREAPAMSAPLRVDVATGRLRGADQPFGAPDRLEGDTSPSATAGP
jgi:hypothetical protein